jgi:hypothetical protein
MLCRCLVFRSRLLLTPLVPLHRPWRLPAVLLLTDTMTHLMPPLALLLLLLLLWFAGARPSCQGSV